MSTHKTTVDQDSILSFLKENFSDEISNFEIINGGESSQAYSFTSKDQSYVLRVNKHHTLGFKKDEYASVHFSSPAIPVPKIYKIGKINADLRFCISEKAEGNTLMKLSPAEKESLRPEMLNVLDAIHATDISSLKGYGKWDAEGQGTSQSWKEHLLGVDKYAKGEMGAPPLFETTFLEKDFWDKAYTRFVELLPFCPEEKFLVHGDFGLNNVLSNGKKITGVIDWEASVYGDFLYDIAWLGFWSGSAVYETLYAERAKKKGLRIENFSERILCYKIFIGLVSLSFYAYSGQKQPYGWVKEKVMRLVEKP